MGRELKRVPLNFNWELNKVWKGYINPYYQLSYDCPKCEGTGYSQEYELLQCLWYQHLHADIFKWLKFIKDSNLEEFIKPKMLARCLSTGFFNNAEYHGISMEDLEPLRDVIFDSEFELYKNIIAIRPLNSILDRLIDQYARVGWGNNLDEEDIQVLLDEDSLREFTRVPINEEQIKIVEEKVKKGGNNWLPFNNGYIPTPEEVNRWSRRGFGHDSSNSWYVIRAKLKKFGYENYTCTNCGSEGRLWNSEKDKENYENWEDYDPPEGEGYQLWENVSEGSPQSPVFQKFEDLCEWCEKNATTFADFKATKEQWAKMLDSGFVYHQEGNMFFT